MKLFGELKTRVVVELYDKDLIGDDDFLGRFTADVQYRSSQSPHPPILKWHNSMRGEDNAGEVLATFELIPIQEKNLFPLPEAQTIKEPLTRKMIKTRKIPVDIRPEMEKCEIEVRFF